MQEPAEIKIKFLRLNSGEDIISEILNKDDKTYVLINPLKIIYGINQKTGYVSISLVQWIFPKITENLEFDISISNILIESNASISMTQYYYDTLSNYEKKYYQREEEDEDDEDEDYEITDEDLEETKEMIESALKNKRLH